MVILERTAKLNDVAREAGVSQGTVSNVFNRPDIVSEEVRERVREVARKLGYKGADPKGRLLRAGKVNAIGIATVQPLSYFFADPFARVVMEGIAESCDAAGAGISLVSAASDEALAWNIQSALVDGLILFCVDGGPRLVQLTRERQLPFVALVLEGDDETINAIGIDNVAGGRLAGEHLARLGHQRVAVLTMPVHQKPQSGPVTPDDLASAFYATSRDRVTGFLEALSAHGIDTSRVPVFETHNDDATVHASLEQLFAGGSRPTALFVQSDRAALIAIRWLRERGLDVPGDVSVIGFDGVREGESSDPPLTTVAQPLIELGRRAVAAILTPGTEPQRQTLPLELVVRGTTAPPRT